MKTTLQIKNLINTVIKISKKTIFSQQELELYNSILQVDKLKEWFIEYIPLSSIIKFEIDYKYITLYMFNYGIPLSKYKVDTINIFNIKNQIISALHYLHYKGFVHNDINPNNILINKNNKITLIDFGLTVTNNTEMKSFMGHKLFSCIDSHCLFNITYKNDLESLCYVFYFLIHKTLPWNNKMSHSEIRKKKIYFKINYFNNKIEIYNELKKFYNYILNLTKYEPIDYTYLLY